MKTINGNILNQLSEEAKKSERLRKNYNYHDELSDTLQRLLNAMEPNTYVQPHKHEDPDKREFFVILRGKALVATFDDNGEIHEHFILDPDTENYGIEIPEKTWHTVIALKKDTVLFEVKDGPYEVISDKNFAEWAPKENEPGCQDYNNNILNRLKIKL